MDYKQWLNRELEKAQKRERDQDFNYQMTGNSRHYNAKQNAEYLGKALQTALAAEEGRSESKEQAQRMIMGFINEIKSYIQTLPADKAIEKIQDIITVKSYLYKA